MALVPVNKMGLRRIWWPHRLCLLSENTSTNAFMIFHLNKTSFNLCIPILPIFLKHRLLFNLLIIFCHSSSTMAPDTCLRSAYNFSRFYCLRVGRILRERYNVSTYQHSHRFIFSEFISWIV